MSFVALDVETANADLSSICQIGLARCGERSIEATWGSYVNPEDEFDPVNVSIHGITPDIVRKAPTLPMIADELKRQISSEVVVCHTHFDRVAISQAYSKYRLQAPNWCWLDTAKVARRAWQEFAQTGYGLKSICDFIGYEFHHHDALEDAKASAHILLAAMAKAGIDVQEWQQRVSRPIGFCGGDTSAGVARVGNVEGACHGEVLVFTGSLTVPRREAADVAARIGCDVGDNVTKNTTMLVVGDQDIRKLSRHKKSSKHLKAEALIAAGQAIRILRESDFMELVKLGTPSQTGNA